MCQEFRPIIRLGLSIVNSAENGGDVGDHLLLVNAFKGLHEVRGIYAYMICCVQFFVRNLGF